MKKKNSLEVHVFGLFPGVQKSGRFFGTFAVELVLQSFSGNNSP